MSNLAEAQRAAHLGGDEPIVVEPRFVAVLRKIDRALMHLEGIAVTLCLFALIVIGAFAALKRRFAPPAPFWTDELVRYLVFFIGLVGAALAAQSERLFNIDLFARALGARLRLAVRMLTGAFTIYVSWLWLTGSLVLRDILLDEKGDVIDPRWGVLALPAALICISVHLALHLLIDGYYLVTRRTPPDLQAAKAPK
jgi:TRAP-type C4-dicarboxylate transport system permease small subunit